MIQLLGAQMKINNIQKRKSCRLCKSKELTSVLKLASTPPANAFVTKEKVNISQKKYPLELFYCENCNHVQLLEIVDPSELFGDYVYVSGTSPVFINHFFRYSKDIIEKYKPSKDSYVLDIGSNDGTLLKFFKELGYQVIGVDPAKEISLQANNDGIFTVNDFFNLETSNKLKKEFGEASLITANNVFAHCDDLSGMTDAIYNLLSEKGLFVFEVSYLVDVFQKNLFDTIYHEHLSYHSVSPLITFFKSKNMELIDVSRVETHGGSIRCVVKKNSNKLHVKKTVNDLVKLEENLSFNKKETFLKFSEKIYDKKCELIALIKKIKANKKSIIGFGAPAKATTLMYEYGLNNDILDFIVDDSSWKQNLFSPGLHIPIYSSSILETFKPDFILILAWNFADSIIKNNQEIIKSGSRFIIPLPTLEVI